jgi:glycolate oxidase iron-sulfur subunit
MSDLNIQTPRMNGLGQGLQLLRPRRTGNGGTFDAHHAPDPVLIADCVHCGFCLPSCPTYLLWGEEMDSPRGRIQQMKMATLDEISVNKTFTQHMDRCLGCMACVTACPSGVQYDKLIEATRPQIERNYSRSLFDRLYREMLFSLFPHPKRLRALVPLLWLYQKSGLRRLLHAPTVARFIPERLLGMEAVLPPVRLRSLMVRSGAFYRAKKTKRRRVGLLSGCIQRIFFDPVNAATIRVLTAEGCDVVIPPTQGCCGALSIHSGREEEGLIYAKRLIDTFEAWGVENIVVNVAGCGSNMKEYAHLLRDDPDYAERAKAFSASVRDISELLAELEPVAPRHPLPLRVAYHDACHLAHAQGIRRQPREVLRTIPDLQLMDIPEADICCGSAGTYNLLQPEAAKELGERKARNILSTEPQVIATANPGCLLQITSALQRMEHPLPAVHPIELVDASIRGIVPPSLRGIKASTDRVSTPV